MKCDTVAELRSLSAYQFGRVNYEYRIGSRLLETLQIYIWIYVCVLSEVRNCKSNTNRLVFDLDWFIYFILCN